MTNHRFAIVNQNYSETPLSSITKTNLKIVELRGIYHEEPNSEGSIQLSRLRNTR